MTSWSSLGGGGAKVSGWKPGGEESPPTGLGLMRTTVIIKMDNDGKTMMMMTTTKIMDIRQVKDMISCL